jgi:hypothetical protein
VEIGQSTSAVLESATTTTARLKCPSGKNLRNGMMGEDNTLMHFFFIINNGFV